MDVCIIGAGLSGLCTAIKLKERLKEPVNITIFDENEDVGGTWLVNRYPGCACDIPSHLYSFSFESNPDWSEAYSPQPEILNYIKRLSNKYKLYDHLRPRSLVMENTWDDEARKWRVTTIDKATQKTSTTSFDIVFNCVGALRAPLIPHMYKKTPFRGRIMHSAEWDTTVDIVNKRVAVIGTGASAAQIIPAIVDNVERLHVFQRTPPWIVSRWNFKFPRVLQFILAWIPGLRFVYRLCIFLYQELALFGLALHANILTRIAMWDHNQNLQRAVSDKTLRRLLTPNYHIGCKRVLKSDDYFSALSKPHVDVQVEEIDAITETGIKCGVHAYDVDVIILATGFKVQEFFAPLKLIGRNGVDIIYEWKRDRPLSYLGVSVANLPNYFFIAGPGTILAHNSVIFMIECAADHAVSILVEMQSRQSRVVEVLPTAVTEYIQGLDNAYVGSVWSGGACQSWYIDPRGRVTAIWPFTCMSYWQKARNIDFKKFAFT